MRKTSSIKIICKQEAVEAFSPASLMPHVPLIPSQNTPAAQAFYLSFSVIYLLTLLWDGSSYYFLLAHFPPGFSLSLSCTQILAQEMCYKVFPNFCLALSQDQFLKFWIFWIELFTYLELSVVCMNHWSVQSVRDVSLLSVLIISVGTKQQKSRCFSSFWANCNFSCITCIYT